MPRKHIRLAAGALVIALAACAAAAEEPANARASASVEAAVQPADAMRVDTIEVTIINSDGEPIGTALLTEEPVGVRIRTDISDLPPGEHGFHIHARGECEPPNFQPAGPHFQPENRSHGFLDPQGPHAGDLPMLRADAQGEADDYDFTTAFVQLSPESLLDENGSALIIHAEPDNYRTDTGGSTGPRIACGVISPAGPGVRPM